MVELKPCPFCGHKTAAPAWIPITERLPESGVPVLVSVGKKVLRAAYVAKFAMSEEKHGKWSDGDDADYSEETDQTYWPEGWYERSEGEEIYWPIDPWPTHWMPLPEAQQ